MKIVIISVIRTPVVTLTRRLSSNIRIHGSIFIKVFLDVSREDLYRANDAISGNFLTAGIQPAPSTKPTILINCL